MVHGTLSDFRLMNWVKYSIHDNYGRLKIKVSFELRIVDFGLDYMEMSFRKLYLEFVV